MDLQYPVVTEEEVPTGLICPGCRREVEPGDPYKEIPVGFTGPLEATLLVCVYCTSETIDWERIPKLWE